MSSEESLSACLDGELSTAELDALLAAMATAPALGATASRWSALRAVIQGRPTPLADSGFADRVMAAIAEQTPQSGGVSGRVVPLRSRMPRWSRAWRPAAGLAAAAAVVGAVAVNYLSHEGAAGTSQPMDVADISPVDEAPVIPVDEPVARVAAATSRPAASAPATSPATRFAAVSAQAPAALITASSGPNFDLSFTAPPRAPSAWDHERVQRLNAYHLDDADPRGFQSMGASLGQGRFTAHGANLRLE